LGYFILVVGSDMVSVHRALLLFDHMQIQKQPNTDTSISSSST
jgi:hypothetical protein